MNKRVFRAGVATMAVVAVGVSAAPVGAADSRLVAGTPQMSLAWGPCPADIATPYPHLTCVTLSVPLDYTRPFGKQISLTVSKAPARDPGKRRGTLIVTNGGPGGGWASVAGLVTKPDTNGVARIPGSVLDAYDVVGFDPRGVDHSTPVSCVDPSFWRGPLPDTESKAQWPQRWNMETEVAKSCATRSGELLPHLGTRNLARDMDRIRAGLGEQKISYLGKGYATYVASVYTQLFPDRIDRLILDGTFDTFPEQYFYEQTLAQARAYAGRREEYFSWISDYDNIFHLGATPAAVRQSWEAVMAELRRAPRGEVGSTEFTIVTLSALTSESSWEVLADAISDFVNRGDDTALLRQATGSVTAAAENSKAIAKAVACVDADSPRDRTTPEADFGAVQQEGSFIAGYMMFLRGACHSWPVQNEKRMAPTGAGLPRFLMVNNRRDATAPYAGALRMHRAYPTSVLVTPDSGKFSEVFNAQSAANPQVNRIAADYLLNGVLPDRDIDVPGHPLPVPTAGTTAVPGTDAESTD